MSSLWAVEQAVLLVLISIEILLELNLTTKLLKLPTVEYKKQSSTFQIDFLRYGSDLIPLLHSKFFELLCQ